MYIDREKRELHFKLTYFGSGFAGKKTSISYVCNKTRSPDRSALHNVFSDAADHGRQVWLELSPSSLPLIAGHRVVLHLHANSGALWSEKTRRTSLAGADGVMFVANSDPVQVEANVEAMRSLDRLLAEGVAAADDIPRVICYNKRDCRWDGGPRPVAELQRELNRAGRPYFETVAIDGSNVFASLRALSGEVLRPWRDDPGRCA